MRITEKLAGFVAGVEYADLPREAVARAKHLTLDCLGVTLAGTMSPVGRIMLNFGRETFKGQEATVVGPGFMTSAPAAAFINGTLAHALDIDDTAAGTIAHPSASLLPALFALGEKYRFSGKQLLTAYVLGLEVFYRIALASEGLMEGWHRTSVYGAVATAAASAKLMKLDAEHIQTAIGISTSFSAGLQVNFGTMTKSIQVGNASRSGVVAALLSEAGSTAGLDTLGDPEGFGYAFYSGRFKPEKIVSKLGNPYSIIFPGIGLKIYPCCGLTHSPADVTLNLVREHNISPDEVDQVDVYGEELLPRVLVYHQPRTGYEGKYSLEYVVAAAIFDRQITADTFTDNNVNRTQVQVFLKKINGRVRPDDEWKDVRIHPWNHPAQVVIKLKDGRSISGEAACARGYPDMQLSAEEIVDKYRSCSGQVLPEDKLYRLSSVVLNLENCGDVTDVVRLACT
jgi:2-methylcitrate dehydratase PrpD